MTFDDVVKSIAEVSPRFNKHALTGFVKDQINNSPSFPARVLTQGFKIVPADLELMGWTVVSPEERVRSELTSKSAKSAYGGGPRIPLTVSHLRLVRYKIRFEDEYVYSELYTPYMFDDMLYINDKFSIVRKVILEKIFSRVQDKSKDGISISPVRVNLMFNRRMMFPIVSYTSGERYRHFVVTSPTMFNGNPPVKICESTVLHYLLAKLGFNETLSRFGLNKNDIKFVTQISKDTDEYEYFNAMGYAFAADAGQEPELFLKVKRELMVDYNAYKFVVNVMYILKFWNKQNIDNVYVVEGSFWRVILGIMTFGKKNESQAGSDALTHLKSVDHFLDPLTLNRFATFGLNVTDIYDLLVWVFVNIDEMMTGNQNQNIYESRLDVSNGILVEGYATRMFGSHIYVLGNKTNIKLTDIKKTLKFNPMMFRTPNGRNKDNKQYIGTPTIVGDNFLLSGGLEKIRLGGRAEQRFHPSMMVAESCDAFVGKDIGKTGYLNPFVATDANDAIVRPDYAENIDSITPYIPR